MDQWIHKRLQECLGFEVPDEMVKVIMTLKEVHDIDEYFESLLDMSVPEHRGFVNEFKQRVLPKKGSGNNKGKNNSNNSNKNQNANNNQKKIPNKKQDKPKAAQNDENKAGNGKVNVENAVASSGAIKKKNKFVSLYGQDGTTNDVIILKGRHLCDCQAVKHKLINNCINCGRIVCEQEGSGPCLFCGNLVCTEDEQRLIESSSKKGENLKKSLLQQERPKGWEEALAMRNRLLDYDRSSEKRTTVIDDESDYFRTNSVWLSDVERAKLKKIEEQMHEKKHASRREQKVTIDFAGRQVIEEPTVNATYEDDVLKEIAQTFAHSSSASMNDNPSYNFDNLDECHPLMFAPPPIFDDSVMTIQANANTSKYDGVYNRVQDKELLEVSDLKKCLSMHQPWASLLIAGIKQHEGRSWYTSHRGRLWIAATAKPVNPDEIKIMENFYRRHHNDDSIEFPKQYPNACLLGCVSVQDCLPQEEYRRVHPNGESESPYVFVCSNPQELPIRFPISGSHKLYKLDDTIHIAAVKALQRMAKLKAEE